MFEEKLRKLGKVEVSQSSKNILITKVNEIKVDFVNYKYLLLTDYIIIDTIRMLSMQDIAAMKLNAIMGRGSKKDFVDLFFLLEEFSKHEILKFYNKKFRNGSEFLVLKSLTYFEDADFQPQPIMYKDFDWKKCKEKITAEVLKL